PGNLAAHRLAGREPHDPCKMDDGIRRLPVIPQRIFHRARFGYIGFDKMKVWVMQESQKRLSAKEQRVDNGDMIIGTQQLGCQERADIPGTPCDQYMTVAHVASSIRRNTLKPSTCSAGTFLSVTTSI